MNELITDRIHFMLRHGFKKVVQPFNADYVIVDDKYYYSIVWLLNDYIFFGKICRIA